MYTGDEWIHDWPRAEAFSLKVGSICATIPLVGPWAPNDRIAFALALFRLAQQHHQSVHVLFSIDKAGSGNALVRPVVEASLRSVWVADYAKSTIIEALAADPLKRLPTLGSLVKFMETREKVPILKRELQDILHDLTHGGMAAIAAQFIEGESRQRSNAAMVSISGAVLAGAGFSAARLIGRQDLVDGLQSVMPFM